MIITYHGDNYFKIQSGSLTLLLDPTNQRSFKGANVIVNSVRPTQTEEPNKDGAAFWIANQGEYEVSGLRIISKGFTESETIAGKQRTKTAYRVSFPEDITVGILGYGNKEPDPHVQELLQGVNVLILAIAESAFAAGSKGAGFIRQIQPDLIVFGEVAGKKPGFVLELNEEKLICEERLTFKKKDLKPHAMEIRCLKVL